MDEGVGKMWRKICRAIVVLELFCLAISAIVVAQDERAIHAAETRTGLVAGSTGLAYSVHAMVWQYGIRGLAVALAVCVPIWLLIEALYWIRGRKQCHSADTTPESVLPDYRKGF